MSKAKYCGQEAHYIKDNLSNILLPPNFHGPQRFSLHSPYHVVLKCKSLSVKRCIWYVGVLGINYSVNCLTKQLNIGHYTHFFISGYFTGAVMHVGLPLPVGDVSSTRAHHELILLQIHPCG